MEIIREKEKIYIIAKDESEAKRTELLINRLVNQPNINTEGNISDWEKYEELTKDFKQVPQFEIDKLSAEADAAMWLNFKKRNKE
ncbi:hypothetical protein BH10BAC3_BH10BAC3_12770 [soil metagenome]